MKKFCAGFLTCLVLVSGISVFANSQWTALKATFDVYVNGKKFESDKPIVAIDGNTYLPLKAIGDVLGVKVNWNATEKRVEVGSDPDTKSGYSFNNPAPLNTIQTITKNNILAKVYFKLISIDEGALRLSSAKFSLISNDGKEYDMSLVVAPEPQISATLYDGASSEGWLVYAVKKDDLKPKIVFEKEYDGTGGVWFKGWAD